MRLVFFSLFCLFVAVFASNGFGLYTDGKNNTCLTVFSDQQTYHTSLVQRNVSAELFFENKCGKELVVDFGLLAKNHDTFFFKTAEYFDGAKWAKLSLPTKSVSPAASALVSKKGWGNLVVPLSGARIRVSFDGLVSKGEFLVYAQDTVDPKIVSLLDPWWEDGEIVVDQYTLALWHFNENSGATAEDSNANNHDLTLTNANIWDAVTKRFGASSISPNDLYYGTSASLFDTGFPDNWTVGAWVSPISLYNNGVATNEFWFQRADGLTNEFTCRWQQNTGQLWCSVDVGGSSYMTKSDRVSWPQDEWHFVQFDYNGAQLGLRVDGILEDSITAPAAATYNGEFVVGANYVYGSKSLFRVDEMEVASTDRNVNSPSTTGLGAFAASIERVGGFSAMTGFPVFSSFLDGNLIIDFNVLNEDNNRLYVDINYGTIPWVGGGTVIVKDLNIVSSMCLDGNNNWGARQATCSWDWNISGVADANYYVVLNVKNWNYLDSNDSDATDYSLEINNVSDLNVSFWDENHFQTKLLGITTFFNGVMRTVDATDGNLTISLVELPAGVYSLSAWQDSNYALRYFDINFAGSDITLSPRLLHDVNGSRIDFKFYNAAGTSVLSSPFITVYRGWGDWNIVEQRLAGAGGETSFFLHPDTNYVFKVNNAGSSSYYYPVSVSTQLPKNEISLATISPFDLTVSGIGLKQFLGNTGAPIRLAFPNTTTKYIFDVNAGLSYYNRKYFLDFKGNPLTYSLQPYLVSRADAIQSIFYVRNSYSAAGLVGVDIYSQKSIPTQGSVFVEYVTTDSAGEAALSFIVNDTYTLYFYRNGSLSYTAELRPTSTSYNVYLDLESYSVPDLNAIDFNVLFFPGTGSIRELADGNVDLNQRITITGVNIGKVRVYIKNTGTILYDLTFDGNSQNWFQKFFQQKFSFSSLDKLSTLDVKVQVYAGGYSQEFSHSYYIEDYNSMADWALFNSLQQLPSNIGSTAALFIAIIVSILAMGLAGSQIGGDPSGIGLFGIMSLGFFTYLGWVPWVPFGIACFLFVALFMLTRRVEY
jgi:hypothetical protein